MSFSEPAWRSRLAPPGLLPVQEFVNTHAYSGRPDQLATAQAAGAAVGSSALGPGGRARLVRLREALRGVLLAHGGHVDPADAADELRACLGGCLLGVDIDASGGLVPGAHRDGVNGFVDDLLARVVVATAEGTWPRLKACGNDECRVAYWDQTRSRTARYCTSARCANRARQRTFRARSAAIT